MRNNMYQTLTLTMRKFQVKRYLMTIIGFTILAIWLYPIGLTINTSLKTDLEVMHDPIALAKQPTLNAYKSILDILDFGTMLKNSVFISVGGSMLGVILSILPAYALSRFKIPGGDAIFILLLTGLMIPTQTVIIPLYDLFYKLNLLDKLWGLIIYHGVYGIPFITMLLRGYMASVPKELEYAARVDGCSDMGVFRHVIIPLTVSGIAVALTLNIISVWNDLFIELIFLSDKAYFPVSVGYTIFRRSKYFNSWNMPAASTMLGQLPIVILYIFAYRYIKQGIFAGAVKG